MRFGNHDVKTRRDQPHRIQDTRRRRQRELKTRGSLFWPNRGASTLVLTAYKTQLAVLILNASRRVLHVAVLLWEMFGTSSHHAGYD
jgi:hypothetical protein